MRAFHLTKQWAKGVHSIQRGEGIGKVERRWASKMLFACTHRDSRRNKEEGRQRQHTLSCPSMCQCEEVSPSPTLHGHLLLPLFPSSRTQYCNATPSRDGWKEGRRDEGRLFYGPGAGGISAVGTANE